MSLGAEKPPATRRLSENPKLSLICRMIKRIRHVFGRTKNAKTEPLTPKNQKLLKEGLEALTDMERMLIIRQEYTEKQIAQERDNAKTKYAEKNKRAAIASWKHVKELESDLLKDDAILESIRIHKRFLEGAGMNTMIGNAMKLASRALKGIHKQMNIDQAHDIKDEIAEQQEVFKEIQEAITSSGPISSDQNIDDDELLKELDEMEQEERNKQQLGILPSVPVSEPTVPNVAVPPTNVSDEDLKELSTWAS